MPAIGRRIVRSSSRLRPGRSGTCAAEPLPRARRKNPRRGGSVATHPSCSRWSTCRPVTFGMTRGLGSTWIGPCSELRYMSKRLEVSREIAASPEAVYAAISDVTRMGEWSEECHSCEWHEGCDGPVVGATFDGHNHNGEHRWTTQGKVIEAEPGRAFAFACSM